MPNIIDKITNPVTNRIVKSMPKREFNGSCGTGKLIKWCGDNISSPENRLILGITALASQPFIDLSNKKVDKETRTVSCARSIAKIIAGTLTGVLIRSGYIYLTKNFSAVGKLGAKVNINVGRAGQQKMKEIVITKSRQFFTPSNTSTHQSHAYGEYQNTMGTALAIVTMVFSNFLIDAPLSKFLTNHFNKKFQSNSASSEKNSKGGIK